MLLLDNDDVAKALTIDDCLEVLEASLRDYGLGQVANRPRSHCYAPLGQDKWYLFKTMDAIVPRYDVGGVRLTSEILSQPIINDKKRRVMLPGPSGRWVELILLFRMSTSEPLAIVPGGYLQRMRVGSTAAISAKYLSRQDAQVAALIGTGGIGAPQLEAIVKSLKLDEIRVFSATPQRLSEFVTHWRERVQVPIRQATSTKEAVDGADIVSCATNSFAPVFDGNWLQPGVHVNSVQRGELDDVTIARADVIVIRSKDQDSHWVIGDDLPEEVRNDRSGEPGISARSQALGDIIAGRAPGRTSDQQITLFTGSGLGSAGLGLQLISVAARAYENAKSKGLGRELPTEWFTQPLHT